jgi:hypothetical protein
LSVETELWTRDTGDLRPLLPRAGEWDGSDDFFEFDGEGWLISVAAPEEADPAEIPGELREVGEGLGYRIHFEIEPSNPDPEAWSMLRQTMESIGRALGGVGLDPDSGHPRSFAE